MGVTYVEIAIRNLKANKHQKRLMSIGQLRKAMPWLKRENALGSDIFVRPAGETNLVLLTGLNANSLRQMRQDEANPAVIVEQSGGMFDAWVRVSEKPVSPHILKAVGESFAERYGAAAEAADGKSFGRLAGFTEQVSGKDSKPYVLAHQGSAKVAPMGERAVQQVVSQLQKVRDTEASIERLNRERSASRGNGRGLSR